MLKLLTTLAFVTAGAAVSAAPVRYECTLKSYSRGNWTPVEAIYWIDPADRTILAIDAFIQYALKKPLSAVVEEFGPSIYKFSYPLKLPSRQSGVINITYAVRLDVKRNRVKVRAYVGNNPVERSEGSCTVKNR